MKNVNKSTLVLAVIAIVALIFFGVQLGNTNKLNDKIAKIGETLKNVGVDVDLSALDGDELVKAITEKVDGLKDAAKEAVDNLTDAAADAVNEVTETVTDAAADAVTEVTGGENK